MLDNIPDFYDFFEQTSKDRLYKIHNKKKQITFRNSNSNAKVAVPIINLLDILPVFTNNTIKYVFIFEFEESDRIEPYKIRSDQDIFNKLAVLNELKCDNVDGMLIQLYVEYFKYIIKYLHHNIWVTKKNGWSIDFMSNELYYNIIDETNYNNYRLFSHKSSDITSVNNLFSNLINHPQLLIVFSYGILALSRYRFEDYSSHIKNSNAAPGLNYDLPFGLCLYGKNSSNMESWKKQIAFSFLDYICKQDSSLRISVKHLPYFSTNELYNHVSDISVIGDLPIIIYASNNGSSISTNHQCVKTIEKMQLSGFFKGFPVYISDSPIRRERILNIKVTGIEKLDFLEMHKATHNILNEYLSFLENLNEEEKKVQEYMKYTTHKQAQDEFDEQMCDPYQLEYCINLLASFIRFAFFIKTKHNDLFSSAQKMVDTLVPLLLKQAYDCEYIPEKTNEAESSNNDETTTISKEIFSEIIKEIQSTKATAISRDNDYYYINYDIFIIFASKILKKYPQSKINTYKKLLNECRKSAPPIIRPNYINTKNDKYRTFYFRRSNQNVLLVPKSIFESMLNELT